jgi:hypothetical protein
MAIPEIMASIPEMQTLLMVTAGTASGISASNAPTLATFNVSQDSMQHPYRISSIMSGSILARLMASFMVTAARLAPFMGSRLPPNAPIAVLQPDIMTTSSIFIISCTFVGVFKKFFKINALPYWLPDYPHM